MGRMKYIQTIYSCLWSYTWRRHNKILGIGHVHDVPLPSIFNLLPCILTVLKTYSMSLAQWGWLQHWGFYSVWVSLHPIWMLKCIWVWTSLIGVDDVQKQLGIYMVWSIDADLFIGESILAVIPAILWSNTKGYLLYSALKAFILFYRNLLV